MTLTAGMLLLVRTVVRAPDAGWASATTIVSFALAVALLAGFVADREAHAAPAGAPRASCAPARIVRANLGAMALFGAYFGFQFIADAVPAVRLRLVGRWRPRWRSCRPACWSRSARPASVRSSTASAPRR